MQKPSEDEMKGLEAEIDSAIDRLFVDKKHDIAASFWEESSIPDASQKTSSPLPHHPEPPEDLEFSFPPLPELSDHSLKPSDKKETLFAQDSEPSEEFEFFLSGPSKTSHEKEDAFFGLTMPPSETEDLSSYPSDLPVDEGISFSPGFEAFQEKELEPSSLTGAFEKMETQLLSIEWEITDENLRKTKEEVAASKDGFRGKPDVTHVLDLMERVLDCMIQRERDIRPPMVKFLMDAKETVRLLLRQETSGEISIYKQLAYAGIETRFSSLNTVEKGKEPTRAEETGVWDRMEGLVRRISAVEEKLDDMLKDWENHFSHFRSPEAEANGRPVNITVCKVGKRLLGVETDKVCKLFKIANGLDVRHFSQGKIRLKDFVVRIIDLKKILSIEGGEENQETKILIVGDKGEYKGLMLDQVIKSLSHCETTHGKQDEYFSGTIHWTYQDRPVEIPILDLNQMISL